MALPPTTIVVEGQGLPPDQVVEAPQAAQASLADLRKAVDESAKQVRTSFIWFMTISMYFAVVAATTTHEQLFLGQSIKIPIIDVTLPIDAVYLVSPLVYAIIYVSLLIQTDGLERTLHLFAERLKGVSEEQRRSEATMTCDLAFVHLYLRTSNSFFVTLLTWAVFVVSLFIIPLAIMLLFQMYFLPYKHPWLTYFHMGFVLVTTAVAIFFWFRFAPALEIFRGRTSWINSSLRLAIPTAGAALAFGSTLVLVPEHSWIDLRTQGGVFESMRSIVKRSLDLRGVAIGDDTKVITLDRRNYSGADFSGARLTNVDLTNTDLEAARFHRTTLRKVRIICRGHDSLPDWVTTELCSVAALSMPSASLSDVRMDGLSVGYLNLAGATLAQSRLTIDAAMVNLSEAKLWGSSIGDADFSIAEQIDRFVDWAYFGGAILVSSKVFVRRASGVHELTFANRSLVLMAEAGNDDERSFLGLILPVYMRVVDRESVLRRLKVAFDPHAWTHAALTFKEEEIGTIEPRITCQKTDQNPDDLQRTSARECVGVLGYDFRSQRQYDFMEALGEAERVCSKAKQTPALRTTVESFMTHVLTEQLLGHDLGVLRNPLLNSSRQQPQGMSQSNKESVARGRLAELKLSRPQELAAIGEIWEAVSNSPCICEKLVAANSNEKLMFEETYERVAQNLQRADIGTFTCGNSTTK